MKILLSLAIAAFLLGACSEKKQGPLEKAGQRMDEVGDNIREGENPLKKKGAMERTGEAIDEALGTDRE